MRTIKILVIGFLVMAFTNVWAAPAKSPTTPKASVSKSSPFQPKNDINMYKTKGWAECNHRIQASLTDNTQRISLGSNTLPKATTGSKKGVQ